MPKKKFIDPQICGDCWEEECFGCELLNPSDEDAEQSESEEGQEL